MSFVLTPTELWYPQISGMKIGKDLWVGKGGDEYLYAYDVSSKQLTAHVITESLIGYELKSSGYTYRLQMKEINGYAYWYAFGGGNIYYVTNIGWVITSLRAGVVPVENYDSETGKYTGDKFWSSQYLPEISDGSTVQFVPRGSIRDTGSERTVEFSMPRWRCNTKFGIYTPANSEVSGNKILGVPRFVDQIGNEYIRSSQKTSGFYTYGEIHQESGKWVIGEIGSDDGWYEGSEPNVENPISFLFCKNPESEINKQNLLITFDEYVQGSDRTGAFLGEFAIWR